MSTPRIPSTAHLGQALGQPDDARAVPSMNEGNTTTTRAEHQPATPNRPPVREPARHHRRTLRTQPHPHRGPRQLDPGGTSHQPTVERTPRTPTGHRDHPTSDPPTPTTTSTTTDQQTQTTTVATTTTTTNRGCTPSPTPTPTGRHSVPRSAWWHGLPVPRGHGDR
jgi:hypothetical protein